MQIGVIGAGAIGATLARLAADAGHQVRVANSRGPASLADLVEGLGANVAAATVEEACDFGGLVFEALPFAAHNRLPAAALAGKTVVSASNYYAARDGAIELSGRVDTELVAAHLRASSVVKAFNTIWSEHLKSQGDTALPLEQRRVIFTAGDDAAALAAVHRIVEAFGFAPCTTGDLRQGGRLQEPGSPLYNQDLTLAEARPRLHALQTTRAQQET